MFETDLLSNGKFGSFQTNFTLKFKKEIKSNDVNKKLISASPHGPTMVAGVERFNVSASWKQFARIGRLRIPAVPDEPVVSCQRGSSGPDPDTGVGAVDNILYVKGIQNCQ